jgi:hypothetical protein
MVLTVASATAATVRMTTPQGKHRTATGRDPHPLGPAARLHRRRRGQQPQYLGVLPDGFSATVATSLYGVAAPSLPCRAWIRSLVAGGDGIGQWLSGAIVAAALAIAYGISLYRTVLTRARLGAATFPLDQAGRLLS